jgi:hypothetical protein
MSSISLTPSRISKMSLSTNKYKITKTQKKRIKTQKQKNLNVLRDIQDN